MKKIALFLLVASFIAANVHAETNIGLKGIGGRAGFVDPEGGDGTITLGVVADMGTWTENLPWEMALTYWDAGEERGPYDWSYRDIAYRNTVYYLFKLDRDLFLYPGAGLSLNFYSFDWENQYGSYDDSETDLTLTVLGGLQFPIARSWHGQAELQFDIGDPDQTAFQVDFIYELGK